MKNDKDIDLVKLNADNLKEFTTSGRCNTCKFFNFGKRKCMKKDESGNYVRPDVVPVTYTEPTSKGIFVHVIKPFDCNDFTPKSKKADKEKSDETAREELL